MRENCFKMRHNCFKTHQIALKRRKNKVSPSKICFETDLRRKKHQKSSKSPENCPLRLGHSVIRLSRSGYPKLSPLCRIVSASKEDIFFVSIALNSSEFPNRNYRSQREILLSDSEVSRNLWCVFISWF